MSFVGCWNWKYITWWQVSWTCYAEYGSTDPQWICDNAEELFHLWLQGHLAEQLEGRETLLQDRVCWLQDDGKMYDIKLIQTYYHYIVLGISTGKMKRCNSSVLLQFKKCTKIVPKHTTSEVYLALILLDWSKASWSLPIDKPEKT